MKFHEIYDLQEQLLNEMSIERNTALELCLSLGEQFTEHFNKVMRE